MPCKISVATEVKSDILDCDETAREQIRAFLLGLQQDPLPRGRRSLGKSAFFEQLPCGYFVAWEVLGDVLKMALTGDMTGITVHVLGVGRRRPKR
jgi:hypothetical protein